MNVNSKIKFINVAVVLLLLINTSALIFFFLQKNNSNFQPPPPKNGGKAFDFLVKELALDNNQIAQYTILRNEHKNTADSILQLIKTAKDSLFNCLKQENIAQNTVEKYLDNIATNERNINEVTFTHFKKLRNICTASQQAKFDTVISIALKMQAPPRNHPPHRFKGDNPPNNRQKKEEQEEDDNFPPPPRP
jgi:hypothetical protein